MHAQMLEFPRDTGRRKHDRLADEREADLKQREAAGAAQEAALAERKDAAQVILDAADKLDATADTRERAADKREHVLDLAGWLAPKTQATAATGPSAATPISTASTRRTIAAHPMTIALL